jgi:TRAP-type C4-dicarboxylate transport system permease small subunit
MMKPASARVERVREIISDLVCLMSCGFLASESWLLLLEAIEDGRVTDRAWAPPPSISSGLMTAGMTLLAARFVLRLAQAFTSRVSGRP